MEISVQLHDPAALPPCKIGRSMDSKTNMDAVPSDITTTFPRNCVMMPKRRNISQTC